MGLYLSVYVGPYIRIRKHPNFNAANFSYDNDEVFSYSENGDYDVLLPNRDTLSVNCLRFHEHNYGDWAKFVNPDVNGDTEKFRQLVQKYTDLIEVDWEIVWGAHLNWS